MVSSGPEWLWLAFGSEYGVLLRNGPSEPASSRIRRRELEIDAIADARTAPADPSWWFLQQAQRVLEAVAERYDLGSPPWSRWRTTSSPARTSRP